MQLRLNQLAAHLAKGIAPLYVVHGDEPLLVIEGADRIRNAARAAGYDERDAAGYEERDAAGYEERDAAGDDQRDAAGDEMPAAA